MQIENNSNQKVVKNQTFKPTTMFDITEKDYNDFISKVEKSDMKNGLTRYLSELSKLQQILHYADKKDDVSKYEKRIEEVKTILKEDFGVSKV